MTPSPGRKTMLLTGASGLLGTAIIELAAESYDIIALVHKSPLKTASSRTSEFDALASSHATKAVRTLTCDLSSEAEIAGTARRLCELGQPINAVIYGAGDLRFLGPTTDVMFHAAAARSQLEVNLLAPAILCSALFQYQWKSIPVEKQDASILLISSISGIKVFEGTGQGIYAASKAALNMLTLYMASEYGKYGIRVNGLNPGRFGDAMQPTKIARGALSIASDTLSGKVYNLVPE